MLLLEIFDDIQPLECFNYLSVLSAIVAASVEKNKQIYFVLSVGLLLCFYLTSTTFYILAHWRVFLLFVSVLLSLALGNSFTLDILVLISAVVTLIVLILFPIVNKKKLTGATHLLIFLVYLHAFTVTNLLGHLHQESMM